MAEKELKELKKRTFTTDKGEYRLKVFGPTGEVWKGDHCLVISHERDGRNATFPDLVHWICLHEMPEEDREQIYRAEKVLGDFY